MTDKYIVIIQRAYCSEYGSCISYDSDLKFFVSSIDAINHGIDMCDSDDFNIGTVRNNKLIAFNWMKRPIKGHDLDRVADEIGL
ncbi:hypothetical protein SSYM_0116 [Serratia symbiotica str. Tucson]|uniref:Uncharacterized protein n=2 Tax=Serratia symbiotica TaxID=138074 RepID=E9CQF1_9GAMM|nr:hypothetical protein [Serratia symbiotica]EFW11220.1 hypothetical protein SSYM_0116 [Serratia symbiotica str. Tucson]BBI92192.1 uncharacterized protein SSYIS1_18050 [Serratia symbiotica]